MSGGRAYPADPPQGEATRLVAGDLDPAITVLRLGVTPYTQEDRTRRELAPLIDYLRRSLGFAVELVPSATYGALVSALTENQVDIAMLSPASYVQARRINPGIQLAARALSQGSPEYSAYIIVRRDDRAQNLADLRGRKMAWVDKLSGSGYLYPMQVLRNAKLDPAELFSRQTLYGTHDAALAALLLGEADAAAVASGALSRTCQAADINSARGIRVLHKCGRLPYDALVVRSGIGYQALKKIAWVFQGLNNRTEHGRRILAGTWNLSGWMPADDSVYDGVREHMDQLSVPFADDASPVDLAPRASRDD